MRMLDIPENIKREIQDEAYEIDDIGMSKSNIMLFADKVLKVQENSDEVKNEIGVMQWLEGKLSVPRIILHELKENKSYLLMTRVAGRMACNKCYLDDPEKLTTLLARALKELWSIDISDCPNDQTLDRKLEAAKICVENNLVDMDNVEPDTFGPDGFENPEALLQWLITHRPPEELVFSHGDFCLPNIYMDDNGTISFIDLGRMGVADKWQDIALCYRSLRDNYKGRYGGTVYLEYDPELLFEKLGLAPDWEKIRYYILLDELF